MRQSLSGIRQTTTRSVLGGRPSALAANAQRSLEILRRGVLREEGNGVRRVIERRVAIHNQRVVWILKRARQPVADCVVEADVERAPAEPKVFTRIHFKYAVAGRGLDPKQVERAVRLSKEKYCSAMIMLAHSAEITYEVRIVDADRLDAKPVSEV